MAVDSPVSPRLTVAALLLLTFATGLVDAINITDGAGANPFLHYDQFQTGAATIQ